MISMLRFDAVKQLERWHLAQPLLWTLIWLAVAAFIGSGVARGAVALSFVGRAQSTSGVVVAYEAQNHGAMRVAYEVRGARYEVADSLVGPPNPVKDDLRPGDSVVVFYDPAAPARAVLSDPNRRAYTEAVLLIIGAVIMPSFLVGGLLASLAMRRRVRRFFAERSRPAEEVRH